MKTKNLLDLLKQGYIVLPLYLLQIKDKLSLSTDDFIFLVYLINQQDKFLFDPARIGKEIGIELVDVMSYISSLSDRHLLEVNVEKNEKGIMEEYVDMTLFYEKVTSILIEEINHSVTSEDISVYETFEKEFGRTLSPMEYEIIKAWVDSNISQELILKALKEAIYNGVANLRYIDKILYEWDKKGFKTVNDVDNHQLKRREEKKDKPKAETFDYNWFDDEDE